MMFESSPLYNNGEAITCANHPTFKVYKVIVHHILLMPPTTTILVHIHIFPTPLLHCTRTLLSHRSPLHIIQKTASLIYHHLLPKLSSKGQISQTQNSMFSHTIVIAA
mmetsp:Transcript_29556/g.38058  ORF Transcript_29556/g.38058 Transcript_29556/m.38058 type:complete len:108 (+) Transcript_29556:627-950(+)